VTKGSCVSWFRLILSFVFFVVKKDIQFLWFSSKSVLCLNILVSKGEKCSKSTNEMPANFISYNANSWLNVVIFSKLGVRSYMAVLYMLILWIVHILACSMFNFVATMQPYLYLFAYYIKDVFDKCMRSCISNICYCKSHTVRWLGFYHSHWTAKIGVSVFIGHWEPLGA